jgi:hypothetical protein
MGSVWDIYHQGKSPWYPLDMRLSVIQTWFGHGGKEKIPVPAGNKILAIQPIASYCTNRAITADSIQMG